MNTKIYEFDAVLQKVPNIDGAYIDFPYDVQEETGKQPGDTIIVIKRSLF